MVDAQRELLMVVGRVREIVTAEVLEWGNKILAAERDKDNETLKKEAMEQGAKVQALAVALSKRLGPES